MSPARNWREIKAEAHHLHPELADPAVRAEASARLDAYVAGYHLEELRKPLGKTQSEIAAVLGVSQSRVSQIENGDLGAPWNSTPSGPTPRRWVGEWRSPSASAPTPSRSPSPVSWCGG
ncbi:hypothetical protein JMUB6875_04570 [Nocardia sp. JMUB6875]